MTGSAGRTRQGLAILSAALAFGIAADVLARAVPSRLDVALGAGTLVLLIGYLALEEPELARPTPALGPAAGLLALALIWRDSPTLFGLNLLAFGVLALLAAPRIRALGKARATLTDYAVAMLQAAGGTLAGALALVFADIDWRGLPDGGPVRRLRLPAFGLMAALPVTAVFARLLMDADPVFDRLVTEAVALPLDRMVPHLALILLWGWLAAGLLRTLLRPVGAAAPAPAAGGRFGFGEVATVLAAVDLLFLVFVAVQFRYLFGGSELVRNMIGLSYAEYARSGFFQLVAVAALSLPLLLAADWALGQRDRRRLRSLRMLSLLMLLLLDVMLASALFRMRLYTVEYGLTELRLYTTAFMAWLVLGLGWFAATVLRGRRERFAPGAIVAAGLVLGALNLLNPDALIARTNLTRAAAGKPIDAGYAARLSADAVPTMRRMIPALPRLQGCELAGALQRRWDPELAGGRRWNIALRRAALAVEAGGWGVGPEPDQRACVRAVGRSTP